LSVKYPDKKIIVIIIAYNAEKTINDVINEIPRDYVDEIIVGDDASPDKTLEKLQNIADIQYISNSSNLQMGGNLKVLFDLAIKQNADIIIQLHGDNQYDASAIPKILDPIMDNNADLVLGSRILGGKTFDGGMPTYKFFGNHLLNFIQNLFYGVKLSDYATGYKAYSATSLANIPYNNNRDDFIFDEELNTQYVYFGYNLQQVGIPTRYFKGASSVNFTTSVHYGLLTVFTVIQYILAKINIYIPKFLRK
jgi:glycosyltransferase involved in cell wall biosynthesis